MKDRHQKTYTGTVHPEGCHDTSFSHQHCIIAETQSVGAVYLFSEVKKIGMERTSGDYFVLPCLLFLSFLVQSKIVSHVGGMRNFQNCSVTKDLYKYPQKYSINNGNIIFV